LRVGRAGLDELNAEVVGEEGGGEEHEFSV
jgi:hypothetical protein